MTGDQAQAAGAEEYARVTGNQTPLALSPEQRRMLAESLVVRANTESENGRYARDVLRNGCGPHFYGLAAQARELAALIEAAESVVVTR